MEKASLWVSKSPDEQICWATLTASCDSLTRSSNTSRYVNGLWIPSSVMITGKIKTSLCTPTAVLNMSHPRSIFDWCSLDVIIFKAIILNFFFSSVFFFRLFFCNVETVFYLFDTAFYIGINCDHLNEVWLCCRTQTLSCKGLGQFLHLLGKVRIIIPTS